MMTRRKAIETSLFGALGAATLVGCGGGSDDSSLSSSGSSSSSSSSSGGSSSSSSSSSGSSSSSSSSSGSSGSCIISAPSCVIAPTETLGPYPAFSNGVVTMNSLWRSDITSDPADTYSTRTGVPLEMIIKIVNTNDNCAPLVGYDVYVWHCDKDGYYSYYSVSGYLGTKNYTNGYFLRGVQTTDACGEVTFTNIFPGWYTGRYPHLHLAVSLGSTSEAVTQMTWPDATIRNVYANSSLYSTHGQADTTFASDGIFEGNSGQIATTSGSIDAGYQSQWVLGIAM